MTQPKKITFGQSLMERLSETKEIPHTTSASLRFLKEIIRRDLETLLNTRKPMRSELEGFVEASDTVLNYGLDDLSSFQGSRDLHPQAMQRAIEECLSAYEPRLLDVSVSVLGSSRERREIRLHIEATLPVYPSTETVRFDTVFDVAKELYSVV